MILLRVSGAIGVRHLITLIVRIAASLTITCPSVYSVETTVIDAVSSAY